MGKMMAWIIAFSLSGLGSGAWARDAAGSGVSIQHGGEAAEYYADEEEAAAAEAEYAESGNEEEGVSDADMEIPELNSDEEVGLRSDEAAAGGN